jgi:hypothetical protein
MAHSHASMKTSWLGYGSWVAPLIDLVIAAVVPIRELRRHVREEQANLVRLLGAATEDGG